MRILMIGTVKTQGAGGMATHTEELISHIREFGGTVKHYKTAPDKKYPGIIDKLLRVYSRTVGLSLNLVMNSRKFDIVHVQVSGPLAGLLPAITSAIWRRLIGFNLLVTFHYRPCKKFLRKYYWIFDFIFSQTAIFFVVSQEQKGNIEEIFGEKVSQKIQVIYNGFDQNLFHIMEKRSCRERLQLPIQKKILLNVANLYQVKGQKYLLQAMAKVVEAKDDVLLVIVGDGPLRKDLERQVKNLGLESHVKFAGSRPHSEIPLWMNAADLFVLPSLSEGNPTVMFEALGVGLPFIGTAVGGVPEIITSEDYGLLCPPADPECLAEKILIGLDNEWNSEGIRRYAEQFTWEKVARQVMKVYDEVLGNAKT